MNEEHLRKRLLKLERQNAALVHINQKIVQMLFESGLFSENSQQEKILTDCYGWLELLKPKQE